MKNLHPKVSEDDLAAVFGHFRARDGCPRVRVLVGRMRGQAFVEFDGKEKDKLSCVKSLSQR